MNFAVIVLFIALIALSFNPDILEITMSDALEYKVTSQNIYNGEEIESFDYVRVEEPQDMLKLINVMVKEAGNNLRAQHLSA